MPRTPGLRLKTTDERYSARALAAARLKSQGLDQAQIAKRLTISQPQVSRLLKYARDEHWLIDRCDIDESQVPDGLLDQARSEFLQFHNLEPRITRWTPTGVRCRIHVLHAVETFHRLAAERVRELLVSAKIVGVMWGRTMSDVVEGLGSHASSQPWRTQGDFKVIPLCAEPLHLLNVEQNILYSSSRLAVMLYERLTGRQPSGYDSLAGVPAYISRRFSKGQVAVIRGFLETIPGYRAIFGAPDVAEEALIKQVDTILTGVGIVGDDQTMGTFLRERLAQEPDIASVDLLRLVSGDVGGVLLPRPGICAKDAQLVEALNAGWLGMTAENFRVCARSASKNGGPGVIVIASGAQKAEIIRAAVQAGFVNEIIINHECATALERLNDEPDAISLQVASNFRRQGTRLQRSTRQPPHTKRRR